MKQKLPPRYAVMSNRDILISRVITDCPNSVKTFEKYRDCIRKYEYLIPMSSDEYDFIKLINKLLKQDYDTIISIITASTML